MIDNTYFFALDLGATSGRSVLANIKGGKLEFKELTRFPNQIMRIGDQLYWNIYSLFEELKRGLKAARSEGVTLRSIGIDTWGVDFVYAAEDGSLLNLPRSYRDPYTEGIPEEYFKHVSLEELYRTTGIQIMNFNSLFQLYAARKEDSSALKHAASILFIPDALSYLLTGKKVCEYSIASTSQILNPYTKAFEQKLLDPININTSLFPPIVMPGTIVGLLSENVRKECHIGEESVAVVAVAGHDTASAVAAVPAGNERFAYLSSGTWSLMGIEVPEPIITEESFAHNFTNEGGVDGSIRFLKNITGMWLLESCLKEWQSENSSYSYDEVVEMAFSEAGFQFLIDPDYPGFANPESMTKAIVGYCKDTQQPVPSTHAQFVRCIFDSLALKYKYVLGSLRQMAPFEIETLHIIGGGSQNRLLNQFTANAIGMKVIAGPSEATAIGNVMLQAKALGLVGSLAEMREIIRNSVELKTFLPQETTAWESAYTYFLSVTKLK